MADKNAAIDKPISLMDAGGRLNSIQGYKEGILAREALGSTAIGEGIAIPHAKVDAVKEPGLAAMVVPEGVDYEAFDGSLANLIFMIAAPAAGDDVHLQALSRLSTLLMNPGFKESPIGAKDADEFLDIIDKAENERFGEEEKKTQAAKNGAEDKKTEKKEADQSIRMLLLSMPITVFWQLLRARRYCPYLHGSGKSGKYWKEIRDFL